METVTPKPKGGRPATGRDPLVQARMPLHLICEIDFWMEKFEGMDRSTAIRCLVKLGMRASRENKGHVLDPKNCTAYHPRKTAPRKAALPKVPLPPPPDDDEDPSDDASNAPTPDRRRPVRVLPKSEIDAAVERAIARSKGVKP